MADVGRFSLGARGVWHWIFSGSFIKNGRGTPVGAGEGKMTPMLSRTLQAFESGALLEMAEFCYRRLLYCLRE
jgi:hypothetical protein